MSAMLDDLWPIFLTEVTEQLESLELELAKSKITDLDIHHLFRLFHTIKSSCAMLDFKSMEEIAHACEDILDLARKNEIAFSEIMVDVMLDAVTALKEQLAEAESTSGKPSARKALVDKILSLGKEKPSNSRRALSIDISNNELDRLEKMLKANLDIALFAQANDAVTIRNAQIKLRNFFDLVGIPAIVFLVRKLLEIGQEQNTDSLEKFALASDIVEKITLLENVTGRDLAVSAYRQSARAALADEFQSGMARVGAGFCTVQNLDETHREKLFHNLIAVNGLARLVGEKNLSTLLDQCFQLLKTHLYDRGIYRDMDRATLTGILQRIGEVLQVLSLKDHLPKQLAKIEATLGEWYAGQESQQELKVEIKKSSWARDLPNREQWVRHMTHTQIEQLEAAYQNGNCIYVVDVDLESSKEFSARFVQWLYKHSRVMTNIHLDGSTASESSVNASVSFLVCKTKDAELEVFEQQLSSEKGFVSTQKIAMEKQGPSVQKVATAAAEANTLSTLRVESKTLDAFVSQVGEIVTIRNMMSYQIGDGTIRDISRLLETVSEKLAGSVANLEVSEDLRLAVSRLADYQTRLQHADNNVQQAISHIQEEALELRVVPVSVVFNRIPVIVRRLTRELGKDMDLLLSGEGIKIDKSLVDILMEPLSHIIRNAIDHGIESAAERQAAGKSARAKLEIAAKSSGNVLRIEIRDDGRGLQREKLLRKAKVHGINLDESSSDDEIFNLIFLPGLSTSEVITETSGRGVGMDAVRSKIAEVGGRVSVSSVAGQGTQFILEMPLTVTIQGMIIVETAKQRYAIPERNISEILEIPIKDLQSVHGQCSYMLRGRLLPIYCLDALLGFAAQNQQSQVKTLTVAIVNNGVAQIGLMIDSIHGRHEIFIKEVNQKLFNLPGFGGASILGDGSVVMILDGEKMIRLASKMRQKLSDIAFYQPRILSTT